MNFIVKISTFFQLLLAPIRCVVCGKGGKYICELHEKSLLGYPTCCGYCTTPTTHTQNCDAHSIHTGLSGLIVGFFYTNLVSYIVHRAKYSGSYHILTYFAQKLALLINLHISHKIIHPYQRVLITYIPMYYKKEHYQRGYNQAQKLAQYISSELSIECIQLLTKVTSTQTQITKSRKQRQKIGSEIYKTIPTTIRPHTLILLVDDVVTTGATLESAAYVLKQEYPTSVIWGVCIARNK